jgi:hypothetical protein
LANTLYVKDYQLNLNQLLRDDKMPEQERVIDEASHWNANFKLDWDILEYSIKDCDGIKSNVKTNELGSVFLSGFSLVIPPVSAEEAIIIAVEKGNRVADYLGSIHNLPVQAFLLNITEIKPKGESKTGIAQFAVGGNVHKPINLDFCNIKNLLYCSDPKLLRQLAHYNFGLRYSHDPINQFREFYLVLEDKYGKGHPYLERYIDDDEISSKIDSLLADLKSRVNESNVIVPLENIKLNDVECFEIGNAVLLSPDKISEIFNNTPILKDISKGPFPTLHCEIQNRVCACIKVKYDSQEIYNKTLIKIEPIINTLRMFAFLNPYIISGSPINAPKIKIGISGTANNAKSIMVSYKQGECRGAIVKQRTPLQAAGHVRAVCRHSKSNKFICLYASFSSGDP